jgi:hypothetical protein
VSDAREKDVSQTRDDDVSETRTKAEQHASVAAWFETRSADVPPELAERVRDALAACGSSDTVPGAAISAATTLLRDVLRDAPMSRAHALDVLAADALMTYAFEGAAAVPERFPELAEDAMTRIADLVPMVR